MIAKSQTVWLGFISLVLTLSACSSRRVQATKVKTETRDVVKSDVRDVWDSSYTSTLQRKEKRLELTVTPQDGTNEVNITVGGKVITVKGTQKVVLTQSDAQEIEQARGRLSRELRERTTQDRTLNDVAKTKDVKSSGVSVWVYLVLVVVGLVAVLVVVARLKSSGQSAIFDAIINLFKSKK